MENGQTVKEDNARTDLRIESDAMEPPPVSTTKEIALLDAFKSGIEQSLALVQQMSETDRAAALSTLTALYDQVGLPSLDQNKGLRIETAPLSSDVPQPVPPDVPKINEEAKAKQEDTTPGSSIIRSTVSEGTDHASYVKKRKTTKVQDLSVTKKGITESPTRQSPRKRATKKNRKVDLEAPPIDTETIQTLPAGEGENQTDVTAAEVNLADKGEPEQEEKGGKGSVSQTPGKFTCVQCSKQFATKFGLNVHIRSHTGEKPYVCDICNKAFSCSNNRQRHVRETHQGVRPFPCTQCPAGFYKEKKLKQHLMVDHGMAEEEAREERQQQILSKKAGQQHTFPCPNCDKTFKTRSNLRVHEAVHQDEREHECPHCQKRFSFRTNLKRHLMIHTGERPHKCQLCDKGFIEHKSLQLHMSKEHGEYKPPERYQCEECGKRLASRASLLNHHLTHTGSKPHKCSLCEKRFSMKANLKRHVKLHSGDKPWECHKCHKCFTEKKSMEVHYRIHTGEKPYQCNICGKAFAQAGTLQAHKPVHERRRSLCCELCGKSFLRKSHYRFHMQKHTNPPRFHCQDCPLAFYRKADLQRHSLVHTGERPYHCKLCSKQFSRPAYLKDHMNRHLGRRPYSCDYCAVTFAESSARVKHMKRCPMMRLVGDSDAPTLLANQEEVSTVPVITTSCDSSSQNLSQVTYPVSLLKLNRLTPGNLKPDAIDASQVNTDAQQVATAADNLIGLANGGVIEVVQAPQSLQTVNEAEASMLLGHSISDAGLSTIDVTTVKEVHVQAMGTEGGATSHFIFLLQDTGTVDTA